MKRLLIVLLVCASAFMTATVTVVSKSDKVTICHATSSEKNPFETLTISENAVYGPGGHFNENGTTQAGHEEDYMGPCDPEPTCNPEPTNEPTPEPTTNPTPEPTSEPTSNPTQEPTPEPTLEPTPDPTPEPEPTPEATPVGTPEATPGPTDDGLPRGPRVTQEPELPPTDTIEGSPCK
jgi:outer membrane biosynthesis protein TonB